jgi:transposase
MLMKPCAGDERARTFQQLQVIHVGLLRRPVEKPVVLFRYSPTRAGDNAREMLKGYEGYVQSDGFCGYNILETNGSPIRLVGCMAHVRRKFIKVIDARGRAGPAKTGSAEVALSYIGRLYEVEKYAGKNELSPNRFMIFARKGQADSGGI